MEPELHGYVVYDWIGNEDFRLEVYKSRSKKLQKELLNNFLKRVPTATSELQKLVPHIKLDYSVESLSQLEDWLEKEVKAYGREFLKDKPELIDRALSHSGSSVFEVLSPFWRSVGSDLYVYRWECIDAEIARKNYFDFRFEWTLGNPKGTPVVAGYPVRAGASPFSLVGSVGGLVSELSFLAVFYEETRLVRWKHGLTNFYFEMVDRVKIATEVEIGATS